MTLFVTGSWVVQEESFLYCIWYSSQSPCGHLFPSWGLPHLLWAPGYRPLKGSCFQTIDIKGEKERKRERLRPLSSSSFLSFSPTMPPCTTWQVYRILILFKAKGLWRGKEGCVFIHYVELSSQRQEEAPMIIHPSNGILSGKSPVFDWKSLLSASASSLRKYFSFSLKINHMTLNPPFWKPTRSPCFISWVPTGVRCCVWRLPGLAGSLWELSASGSCRRANSGCWTSGSQSGPMSVAPLDVFHQCVYAGSFFIILPHVYLFSKICTCTLAHTHKQTLFLKYKLSDTQYYICVCICIYICV